MRIDAQIPGAIGPDHWFAQAYASALGEVVQALDLGEGADPLEVRAGAVQPEKWADWSEALWHAQTWTPGESARLWIGCSAAVAQALWTHIGGGHAPDETLQTFREILNQSASGAAAEASSRLGATVEATAVEEAPPPESGWAVELHFEAAGGSQTIALVGNIGMAKALNPPAVEETAAVADPPPPRPKTASASVGVEPASDPIELIREVRMELAVSFGDTTMPLADVLKLTSGTIVELNRSVSDPVEVLVNGSVIARGDVVVVDGNYGVRITEIVSRRDRVRSMM